MKKLIAAAITITACAALCAPVWPQTDAGEEVPTAEVKMRTSPILEEVWSIPKQIAAPVHLEVAAAPMAEKEEVPTGEVSTLPAVAQDPEQDSNIIAAEVNAPASMPKESAVSPNTIDPYHTDIYPNNVYSEELIYDADGNLIGKTTTIPTEFGPDTIWIDGHAYYNLPSFGLVEWSGPGQRTEAYTMYESGVKVGIMGGESEAPTTSTTPTQPRDWPESTGEVIDQTINEVPQKNCTPPTE